MAYASLAELKDAIRIVDTVDDTLLQLALDSATELIDGHCDRSFVPSLTASIRSFYPSKGRVDIDDIYTTDGFTVSFMGTVIPLEIPMVSTGYRLEPVNAPAYAEPYTHISYALFRPWSGQPGPQNSVTVTAKWGYSGSTPKAVKNACILQASRLFSRRNSPYGIAGSPDLGTELRLLAKVDPDVAVMLSKYVRMETN